MRNRTVTFVAIAALVLAALLAVLIKTRGFRASSTPGAFETSAARLVRDFAIPRAAKSEKSPFAGDDRAVSQGRDVFFSRCATCHGFDGRGATPIGSNLYPRVPDLRGPATQALTDGEIRYIIANGIQLTGMPAMPALDGEEERVSWALVSYVRSLRSATPAEAAHQQSIGNTAQYVGSKACERCHTSIYARWKITPMANVVRDPREHPDAIIPDLNTNHVAPFTLDQVAFVYGSKWKQRYFTRIGDDYYPLPVQWDVSNKTWRPYHVADTGADWWTAYYPSDNLQRPTGPTCDGCHSVNYDIKTKQVTEWNVGCEKCHGAGSLHVQNPVASTIVNPAKLQGDRADDVCLQCHTQGQPRTKPLEGVYYDWPVGYQPGDRLSDVWMLEEHHLGKETFTHWPDGHAHKNRMQGNDFVQSQMSLKGVRCYGCHDVHGTPNEADLRLPGNAVCLQCHDPRRQPGPPGTLEQHTQHAASSEGSKCIACHMPLIARTVGTVNVRSHTFKFISPSTTLQNGVPNPCTSCHKDRTPQWASDALKKWPGVSAWRVGG